eukprot:gnl/Chilomastix_cuspidata/7516.p2 GENE.gnl/Chilomastix_cuspidata/7516~~gnl/Chilomastix_cuspidata/7516.p2  ORF type:complete len:179 (-),score=47.33 gnl/Chilomastix_cuspidata/7516:36-572(-)
MPDGAAQTHVQDTIQLHSGCAECMGSSIGEGVNVLFEECTAVTRVYYTCEVFAYFTEMAAKPFPPQCGANEYCAGGRCAPLSTHPDIGSACSVSGDCGGDLLCVRGECCFEDATATAPLRSSEWAQGPDASGAVKPIARTRYDRWAGVRDPTTWLYPTCMVLAAVTSVTAALCWTPRK